MKRPKEKEYFGTNIKRNLYEMNDKYIDALEDYIDYLEQKLKFRNIEISNKR